jgi:hypothetical protein
MLKEQPAILAKIIKDSRVERSHGMHMTKEIKAEGEILIKDWLWEPRGTDDKGAVIRNLNYIYSEPLLQELISYNRDGNFDRVMALMMCMYQKRDEFYLKFEKEQNKGAKFAFLIGDENQGISPNRLFKKNR